MSAARASAAGLNMFYVFPVVFGYGRPPISDGRKPSTDFRITFQTVSFIPRQRQPLHGLYIGATAIKHGCQCLGVRKRVMDAWQVSMRKVVRAAIKQAVMGAGRHHFKVPPRDFTKRWLVLRQQGVRWVATIAGAASPPSPFVVAAAPTVVPSTIGPHELHLGSQSGNHLLKDWFVVCDQCIERERGQRFLDVVAQIHRT